jgi:hypothetical protein
MTTSTSGIAGTYEDKRDTFNRIFKLSCNLDRTYVFRRMFVAENIDLHLVQSSKIISGTRSLSGACGTPSHPPLTTRVRAWPSW